MPTTKKAAAKATKTPARKKAATKAAPKRAPARKAAPKKTVKPLTPQDVLIVKPVERAGAIQLGGKPATVIGVEVSPGMPAPAFTATASDWSPVDVLAASQGKVRILAAVPSLDTPTCDRETRRFNEEASKLDPDIVIYTISTDFPFRQKAWCGAAGVERVLTVSDVVAAEFGVKYGVLIKERRYLRRAVFVVDRDGTLTYASYMPSLGDEPNYEEVLAAAKAALAA